MEIVKLLDLGLARLAADDTAAGELTSSGEALGTPDYMAPEQWADTSTADIRSDIYSLGCTMYFLLAGHPPFPNSLCPSVMKKRLAHFEVPPTPIRAIRPDVPPGLEAVLSRMLEKDPSARYAAPTELRAALKPFLAMHSAPPDVRTSPTALMPADRSRVGRSLTRIALAVALAAVAGLGLWRALKPGPTDAGSQGGAAAPPIADPAADRGRGLQVFAFEVKQFRGEDAEAPTPLGALGSLSRYFTLANDDVRISARLSKPAYCYLLAFNPNGTRALCSPHEKDVAPELRPDLQYPEEDRNYYGLTDGEGWCVFVLFASTEPLPPYEEWVKANGEPVWAPESNKLEGIWAGDETGLHLMARTNRGKREKEGPPLELLALRDFYRDRPGRAAIQVFAFPVLP